MESYSEKNFLNWLRNDRIMVMSLAHSVYYNARRILLQSDTKNAFSLLVQPRSNALHSA